MKFRLGFKPDKDDMFLKNNQRSKFLTVYSTVKRFVFCLLFTYKTNNSNNEKILLPLGRLVAAFRSMKKSAGNTKILMTILVQLSLNFSIAGQKRHSSKLLHHSIPSKSSKTDSYSPNIL